MGTLLMSVLERRRLGVMAQVKAGQISVAKAGRVLGISERQVRRIWKRYQEQGDAGLVHGLRGRSSNAADPERRKEVLTRYRQRYLEFGAAHAAEHLGRDRLPVGRSTLWYWLDQEDLVVKRRRAAKHRVRRERRPCVGELVQMDGSTHDWFSGRGDPCVLFVMVDDATGRTLCRFYESEDTVGAFDVFGRYAKSHGLPQALYVDKDSIYRVNDPEAREKGALSGHMPLTQFGRAMKQLEVQIICADSPQAKGRVERKNGVLQDRLVKELTLQGISTIPAANAFLEQTFLRQFNHRFTRTPASGVNLHRPRPGKRELADILCVIDDRTVGLDWCVTYAGRILQIDKKHEGLALARRRVEILVRANGALVLRYKKTLLRWRTVAARPALQPLPQMKTAVRVPWRPGWNHPWNKAARQARSAPVRLASLA